MEDRGIILHGFLNVENRAKNIIVNLNEADGFLSDVDADGRHSCHSMASVQHFFVGQVVLCNGAGRCTSLGQVERLADDGKIAGRDHGFDAGQGLGFAGVDRQYPSVGVRTAEYFAVKRPLHVKICAELGAPCHLVQSILPDGTCVQYPELPRIVLFWFCCRCHLEYSP